RRHLRPPRSRRRQRLATTLNEAALDSRSGLSFRASFLINPKPLTLVHRGRQGRAKYFSNLFVCPGTTKRLEKYFARPCPAPRGARVRVAQEETEKRLRSELTHRSRHTRPRPVLRIRPRVVPVARPGRDDALSLGRPPSARRVLVDGGGRRTQHRI